MEAVAQNALVEEALGETVELRQRRLRRVKPPCRSSRSAAPVALNAAVASWIVEVVRLMERRESGESFSSRAKAMSRPHAGGRVIRRRRKRDPVTYRDEIRASRPASPRLSRGREELEAEAAMAAALSRSVEVARGDGGARFSVLYREARWLRAAWPRPRPRRRVPRRPAFEPEDFGTSGSRSRC